MNFTDATLVILEVIIVLLIAWEIYRDIIKDKKQQIEKDKLAKRKKKIDILCDVCEEVRKLYPTPDGEFYLCKQCMEGFFTEHPEITDEQKSKVRSKYRVAKAAKRKKK